MKSSIKIIGIKTSEDVKNIRNAIASNQGVVACEINKDKGEVSVIYDDYFSSLDNIIDSIEILGYTVL